MRHLSRHLQATVQDHVQRHLLWLGWLGPEEGVPFGAIPVTYQTVRPTEHMLQSVKPNLVAVSFGRQSEDVDQQMGGGLIEQEHVCFIDVLAEDEGIGLALSEDIRDLLVGVRSYRMVPSRFVVLEDQSTPVPTPVAGYRLEFTDVVRSPAERDLTAVNWQVLTTAVQLHMPGGEG